MRIKEQRQEAIRIRSQLDAGVEAATLNRDLISAFLAIQRTASIPTPKYSPISRTEPPSSPRPVQPPSLDDHPGPPARLAQSARRPPARAGDRNSRRAAILATGAHYASHNTVHLMSFTLAPKSIRRVCPL